MKLEYPDNYEFSEEEAEHLSRELERMMPDERAPDDFHERLVERLNREIFHPAMPVPSEVLRRISDAAQTKASGELRRRKGWLGTHLRHIFMATISILLLILAGLFYRQIQRANELQAALQQQSHLPTLTSNMIQVGDEEVLVSLAVFYTWKFQHTGEAAYANEAIKALQAGSHLAQAQGNLSDYLAVMKEKLELPILETSSREHQTTRALAPLLRVPEFNRWYEALQKTTRKNPIATFCRENLS